jgi:hypothetical protein
MTSFARAVAALLAFAVAACAFLPWAGAGTAPHIAVSTIWSPGPSEGVALTGSIALPVLVAAVVVLLGALGNARTLVIVGGLGAVAIPTAWILANAISGSTAAVAISQIKIGAYGTAIAGLMILILAAVAVDARAPSVR